MRSIVGIVRDPKLNKQYIQLTSLRDFGNRSGRWSSHAIKRSNNAKKRNKKKKETSLSRQIVRHVWRMDFKVSFRDVGWRHRVASGTEVVYFSQSDKYARETRSWRATWPVNSPLRYLNRFSAPSVAICYLLFVSLRNASYSIVFTFFTSHYGTKGNEHIVYVLGGLNFFGSATTNRSRIRRPLRAPAFL